MKLFKKKLVDGAKSSTIRPCAQALAATCSQVCKDVGFSGFAAFAACEKHEQGEEHDGIAMVDMIVGCPSAIRAAARSILVIDPRFRDIVREELAAIDALRL